MIAPLGGIYAIYTCSLTAGGIYAYIPPALVLPLHGGWQFTQTTN